ncbi:IclR family transcriptional regulator [Youhaiella tibetensis]|uniref:IclR family transcriptional regulator n=1 Tax=Paradevosia tibetensis TaxID=1447062 RepID=A0A5B9DKQ9_9HYPH|nr:IclR family transcriptional regulator [Youhaiella tibetensis]QEE19733.1 IclR family transcriptional regulator [Youhaiella tibetensis]GGF30481.1 IclR family transcriptional regulator [Youhaiella tibetensis]
MTEQNGLSVKAKPTARSAGSGDESLKSLNKVVRILECFSTSHRTLSLADICARTGYPRSTTHRLLAAMREVGFVEQDRERDHYRLGLRLFEFGNIVLANLELHREGRAIVDALNRLTGHAVHLAVFDGLSAVVIQRTESHADGSVPATMVENSPAYCTSVGKAILAYQPLEVLERVVDAGLKRYTETTITDRASLERELATTRERGFAIDEGEHQPGLRCVGAPIRNQSGAVFAAISVSSPAWQLPLSEIDELNKVVIYHANLISQRLGYVR